MNDASNGLMMNLYLVFKMMACGIVAKAIEVRKYRYESRLKSNSESNQH